MLIALRLMQAIAQRLTMHNIRPIRLNSNFERLLVCSCFWSCQIFFLKDKFKTLDNRQQFTFVMSMTGFHRLSSRFGHSPRKIYIGRQTYLGLQYALH